MWKEFEIFWSFKPEDKEWDALSDKGRSNTGDQSDQVGDDDGWQSTVVIAEKVKSYFPSHWLDEDPPEPSEEEHARNSPQEEDRLQTQTIGLK